MNTYNDEYAELEYGGIYIYKNAIILELFEVIEGIEESENFIEISIGDIEATNIMQTAESDIFGFLPNDTFDLYIESLEKFNIKICGIIILNEENGIWKSQIELINLINNEKTYIDARITDALILSLKENLPIMINANLLHRNIKSYTQNEGTNEDTNEPVQNESPMSLQKLLEKYIEDENYEEATKIKKTIDKIKGGK